jgi:hypothetical protein
VGRWGSGGGTKANQQHDEGAWDEYERTRANSGGGRMRRRSGVGAATAYSLQVRYESAAQEGGRVWVVCLQ